MKTKKANVKEYAQTRGVRIGDMLFKRAMKRAKALGHRTFSEYARSLIISDVNGFVRDGVNTGIAKDDPQI